MVEGVIGRVPDEEWERPRAHERFLAGDLWAEVPEDESMMDVVSQDFEVMAELTRATQPRIKLA
jgi:hypothetical protein